MLNSKDTLTIVERMINKLDINNFTTAIVSEEETLLIHNLLDNYSETNDLKLSLILKLFLSYLEMINSNNSLPKNYYLNLKNIIKTIKFNEIELFLPCRNTEWLLLEFAKNLLTNTNFDHEKSIILDDLLETITELFKIVNDDYGLAITNYFSSFRYFKAGNKEKASRLLEMVSHIFKDPVLIWESQYYAALMNYPANLRRSLNLLENCLLLCQKHLIELNKSNISVEKVEETLNILRREFIIRDHENPDKSFLFKVIDDVIHYYYNKSDLLSLSACYYEAGIIFDKLGYEDTAEEYFVESAIITSEHQQWKLYSKALINLVVKFFEKGRVVEAEDYLNDLIQVASYLKDEGLHKKVETLLLSLKKLKEIKPTQISSSHKIQEYISEIDSTNSPLTSAKTQSITSSKQSITPVQSFIPVQSPNVDEIPVSDYDYVTNLEQEEELNLIQSLDALSSYDPVQDHSSANSGSSEVSDQPIDQTFLTEFKEPINPHVQNEVTISTNDLSVISEPDKTTKATDSRSFYSVRKKICSFLVNNNFEIFTDYKPIKGSVSVDVVALRGKIRKQKLFIMIASDGEGEIELSVNLLVSIFDSAERIVFVNSITPKEAYKKGGVSIIYRVEDLSF